MKSLFLKLVAKGSNSYKTAKVEIQDGKVIAATPAVGFAIGWTEAHLKAQAAKYGIRYTVLPREYRNSTYTQIRPTPEQRKQRRGTR